MVLRRPLPAYWRPGAITFIILAVMSLIGLSLLDRNGIVPPPFTKEALFTISVLAGIGVGFVGYKREKAKESGL